MAITLTTETTIARAMRYQEKVFIIMGSSAGISAATSIRGCGRDGRRERAERRQTRKAHILLYVGDISEEADAKALIADTLKERFNVVST